MKISDDLMKNGTIDQILDAIPSAWKLLSDAKIDHGESHDRFIKWLLKRIEPNSIVELGVDYGYSSFIMALHSKANVYGIDCFDRSKHDVRVDDDYEFVLSIKEKLKLHNLEIIKGYFNDVAKTWTKQIDILHVDGLHDYNNCKNDYDQWSPFLKENGIILFHDTISNPNGVGVFFSELKLPKINFTNSAGLGVASNDANLISEIEATFFK